MDVIGPIESEASNGHRFILVKLIKGGLRKLLITRIVLKKLLPAQKDKIGKLTLNYEGPYVVKRAFSGGALILTNMDGDELTYPVNSDVVKKYYA
uniref:Uncharacterized protein n=1 Tax=Cajanus cajan TaxID=3821 RepID=A0A151U323_CAJCA|nr:hypothetical protein KK1_006318 [Cajanus cajan]